MGKSKSEVTTEELLIEIGKTLLMCQIVEKQFSLLVTWIHPDEKWTIEELWKFSERPDGLGAVLREAAKRFNYDAPTREGLRKFKDRRNDFVHSLIRVRGFNVNTPEGRKLGLNFVTDLYAEARGINETLAPIVTRWAKSLGVPV